MIDNINNYLQKLFPLTRSITGNENRKTLKILQELIPLKIKEYPTNQKIYDWIIPKEWNIKDAWIKDSRGKKIVTLKENNLHIVSYSIPIKKKMRFEELKKHLFYLENLPEAIPYRTSYYNETWGFCVSYNQYKNVFKENEEYEICVDSELTDGSLSIGELLIQGKQKKEILLSSYICHPSMANDSLSGVIATTFIAKELIKIQKNLEYSYRIIFVPETIGAIAYCKNNEKTMKSIDIGFVLTTCGGNGKFGYKQSWQNTNFLNTITKKVFNQNNINFITYPFDINGSDERQYSSQGFKINTITITKDKYYEYDSYHSSLDNLDFVKAENLNETIELYLQLIKQVDKNIIYKNLHPNCEIKLGNYNFYSSLGGSFLPNDKLTKREILMWLLFYCDGQKSLYEISELICIDIEYLYEVANMLKENKILGYVNE